MKNFRFHANAGTAPAFIGPPETTFLVSLPLIPFRFTRQVKRWKDPAGFEVFIAPFLRHLLVAIP